MALTQREKLIAIGTGGALALLGLQMGVIGPYVARSDQVNKDIDRATSERNDSLDVLARQTRLRTVWADLIRGGLSGDVSAAESQTVNALSKWADWAGVAISGLSRDRSGAEGQFDVTGFRFTGTGRTPAVAHFISAIETATIPVRVTDVQVGPRKEGTDELTVQLSISTLTLRHAEPAAKPAASASAAFDGEGRS